MTGERWFTTLKNARSLAPTLIFFHYAGGNSGVYRSLSKLIETDIHMVAIDLPGRAKRFTEPPIDDLDRAADEIERALQQCNALVSRDLIFFGHSVGAKLAFAVAQRLERSSTLSVRHLIASGSRAPHLPRTRPMRHDLPQKEFVSELRSYGGTPEAILEDQDLLELLTPMLRSDFKLAETYQLDDSTPITCDIRVFGGDRDATVEPELLHAWSQHSRGRCDVQMFSGSHFFLHEDEHNVARAIDAVLAETSTRVPG